MSMLSQAQAVLKSTFGYDAFRGPQADVIAHVLAGGDALVLMPTGGGKSLCYQIPALVRPGTGVVVSPLIALMQNQVDRLVELGVRAAYLNSTLTPAEAAAVERRLLRGELDLLYVAPERLLMPGTLALLKRVPLSLFAIDEAHCISQWGHDFRRDYLQLAVLRDEFPAVPRLALTATADERTRREIGARLQLKGDRIFLSSFNRPNIQYRITAKDQPREQLLAFLEAEHQGHTGIVYCLSRNSVEKTAAWLAARGHTALPYHAGLPAETRSLHLNRFLKEDGVVVVATIAFGMGIDKPDVRFVAHLDLPKSLEAYYQETGRAGRDGAPATAWMTYGIQDVIMLRQLLDGGDGDAAFKRLEHQKIGAMLGFCEVTSCRRQVLLQYFGEALSEPCGNCDTCLVPVATWTATVEAQKALSCVFRTGQRFGVNHLIDVLLGKTNERVRALHHDQLSTFGIGVQHPEGVWRSVFRQLIAKGYVKADDYGSLQLHDSATPVLRGEAAVELRRDAAKAAPPPRRARKAGKPARAPASVARAGGRARAPLASQPQTASGLYAELTRHRLALAKRQNLPSYCIFQNATLTEIARARPTTLGELRAISGVGDVKLAKYGEGVLALVRSWSSRSDADETYAP